MAGEHDVSSTPSPPPPAPPRSPTGSMPAVVVEPAEDDDSLPAVAWRARRSRAGVRELRTQFAAIMALIGVNPKSDDLDDEGSGLQGRVGMLERIVGRPGDPIKKRDASGMIAIMLELKAAVDKLTAELTNRDKLQAEQQAKRSRLAWIVGPALLIFILTAAVAAGYQWVSTLRHPDQSLDVGRRPQDALRP